MKQIAIAILPYLRQLKADHFDQAIPYILILSIVISSILLIHNVRKGYKK